MKISELKDMTGGWFIGDFSPTAVRTQAAEVACKHYKAGDYETRHVHKIATELTLLVAGRARMNGIEFHAGQIVTVAPGEPADFEVLEDAITVVVKTPSVIGDKYPAPLAPGSADTRLAPGSAAGPSKKSPPTRLKDEQPLQEVTT